MTVEIAVSVSKASRVRGILQGAHQGHQLCTHHRLSHLQVFRAERTCMSVRHALCVPPETTLTGASAQYARARERWLDIWEGGSCQDRGRGWRWMRLLGDSRDGNAA